MSISGSHLDSSRRSRAGADADVPSHRGADVASHPVTERTTDDAPRTEPRAHRRGRLRPALAAWWSATELDRRLAAGEEPWSSAALAVRARRILTRRSRARVAGGLAGAMRSARGSASAFSAAVTPDSPDVLDARAVIAALERVLRSREPVAARGVAMVRLLLVDGNGPLYRPTPPGLLGSQLRAAAAALRARDRVAV
jgi:hypothetical protein